MCARPASGSIPACPLIDPFLGHGKVAEDSDNRTFADGVQCEQALGRSRGGFGSKIRVAIRGLGLPARLILTPVQEAYMSMRNNTASTKVRLSRATPPCYPGRP